jgi:hypothetical protein
MNGGVLFLTSQGAADAPPATKNGARTPKVVPSHAAQNFDLVSFSSTTRDLHRRKKTSRQQTAEINSLKKKKLSTTSPNRMVTAQ